MTFPTLGVDFSPTTDPFDVPSWSSIVDRVSTIEIRTGRQNELAPFQPGTMKVTLDNHDRLFDPEYTGGTYYPNLKPGKRTRIQATYGATTYDLFTGFVDAWPQTYQPPASAVSNMRATDGMKRLARAINQDPYGAVIAADNPRAWWRLGETAGSVYSDYSGNGYDLVPPVGAPCADNVTGSLTTSTDSAVLLPPDQPFTAPAGASIQSGTTGIFELWIRLDADCVFTAEYPPGLGVVPEPPRPISWDFDAFPNSHQMSVRIDAGSSGVEFGGMLVTWDGGGQVQTPPRFTLFDGQVHHVLVARSGSTAKIYIDGRDMTDPGNVSTSSTAYSPAPLVVNLPYGIDASPTWKKPPQIDEIAIYDTMADPAATAVAHNEAGRRPYLNDRSGERVDRILDLVGWPAGERNIDPGRSRLGAAKWTATTTALSLLDEIERSELGACYIDHADAGKFRFRDRTRLITDPRSNTSQATLTDDPAGTLHYTELPGSFDETTTVNKVTIKWVGGDVVSLDQASIDAYGENGLSLDTILPTYEAAKYFADGLLQRFGTPQVQFSAIVLEPAAEQDLFPEVLERRIGDRITVHKTPQGVGSAIEFDCIVEGIDHVISQGVNSWVTTYYLSRADNGPYFQLDHSALDGTDGLAF